MASYRILIVEDQHEISRLLHSALETLGHEIRVEEIPSGEEAILDSSHNHVDLLVADYLLPGMTGIELMDKMHRYHPEMKVILITGQTDSRIRKEVAEAGADAFFIKPIPMADFLDAVERHLGLAKTFLPPEPIAPIEDEVDLQSSLPDILTNLRKELGATAVLLLNDSRQVLARAGDLPDAEVEISLLSSLLSIYSASQKISHLLGKPPLSNWCIFEGGEHDLIFIPAGEGHCVLAIGQNLAGDENIRRSMGSLSEARLSIEASLEEKTTPGKAIQAAQEPLTTPLDVVESSARELEPLFEEAGKNLKPAEVDDFWNEAAQKQKAPTKPDMLSYDQARQLGLTPEDTR